MKRVLSLLVALSLWLTSAVVLAENVCPLLEVGDYFPLDKPVTLTALAINTVGQYSVKDSYVLDWIKEKTNITLEITHELYGDEGEMQLSMLMASGQRLPDILLNTRWSKAECALYGAQGLVIPLDEYLKDCVNWNRLNEICGAQHRADLTMADGHIYSFGSVNECFHVTHQARMWVYQPWIDLLCDGELPRTTEEFYQYLHKVATMDPNGNGLQDEIPLTGQIDAGWATDPFTFLSNAFVHNNRILGSSNQTVAPGCYLSEDGQVRCNWVEDGYREALRYMNRLFQEGLLDRRTYTQDGRQMDACILSEPHLVGATVGGHVPARYLSGGYIADNDDWLDWACLLPLQGPDGLQLTYQSDYDYFYNCNGLITRDCLYPEIAVQLFDLLCSAEGTLVQNFGQENILWSYCETDQGYGLDGSPALYRVVETVPSTTAWPPDVQIASNFLAFRNARLVVENEINSEKLLWDWAASYDAYSPGAHTVFPNIAYTYDQSVAISTYASTIDAYVEQATVQFIIGALDIERDWDAYLSILQSMGQEEYHQILQQAYDAAMK